MVRLKNRYLLVNILYPSSNPSVNASKLPDLVSFNQPTTDGLTPQVLVKAIRAGVLELFGEYGAGAVADSLAVKYLSPATSTFILRTSRAHYNLTWAVLSLMNTVPVKDGKPCIFRVVRVSGTIRKAEEEAIRRAREIISRARREMGEAGDATLDRILGKPSGEKDIGMGLDVDFSMVDGDGSDSTEDSDGDG